MKSIDELIAELCPDGVEYKQLNELGKFYGGLIGKCKDDFANGNAKFISYMNVYSNPATNLEVSSKVKIAESEKQNQIRHGDILFTGSSETRDECAMSSVVTADVVEPIYLNSFCFGLRLFDETLYLPTFLKHLLRGEETRKQLYKTASGVTRFNVSKEKMARVTIPLPPLAVQKEIVRILDGFMGLIEELEAELAARRKQYEQYRDKLLTFGDEVERQSLGEVFEVQNGYTPSKSKSEYWRNGDIPWFRMEDIRANGRVLNDSIQHITKAGVKGKLFPANSIIISTLATIGEHALILRDFLANQQLTNLRVKRDFVDRLFPKFIFYVCFELGTYCRNNINSSGFSAVSMKAFRKFQFPIPSLAEQKRIVEILDKFDALCNDETAGLAVEIAARKKQYEYYRDKLLTFKKAS